MVILAEVINQVGYQHLTRCVMALKTPSGSIQNASDLIVQLGLTQSSAGVTNISTNVAHGTEAINRQELQNLISQCYPDMPETSVGYLVESDVSRPLLQLINSHRHALQAAKSDFVVVVIHRLLEQHSREIEQIIGSNPTFIVAMQVSNADWQPSKQSKRNDSQ